jgi:hypothetical protein
VDGPRILSAGQRYPITIQASSPAPLAAPTSFSVLRTAPPVALSMVGWSIGSMMGR